jgi:tetratricopeptide (TPR) repeat protein
MLMSIGDASPPRPRAASSRPERATSWHQPSRRARVILVAAIAVAAALGVAGGAALVGRGGNEAERPSGVPPFVVDLGVRTDPEAQALRRASRAYGGGERRRAAAILEGRNSLQAQVGRALAGWPAGSLGRLEQLAVEHPRSGAVLFHLGLARFWDGDREGALGAWRAARTGDPNTAYAIRASDLLFRNFPPGLPTFIPSFRPDPGLSRLSPRRQLAELERRAGGGTVRAKLLYGLALQRLERPISAQRQYAAAARLAPRNPEALAADAVGRFDKAHPERAFSRLGPLSRRYPSAATVRFHLGLLLLWLGQVEEAKRQLGMAAQRRESSLAREANRLLARLEVVPKPR